MKRILIIKLGALGDFFIASSAFEAIRIHHSHDHLTILTTPPYEKLAHQLGYFDAVWIDQRPGLTQPRELWNLRQRLLSGDFDRVYDLQMVDRTNLYCHLTGASLWKHPEWIGSAWGASHRYKQPRLPIYHQERLQQLLSRGGINSLPPLNLTRLAGNIRDFPVKFPYVLLVPGASKQHRANKCWPMAHYGDVALHLVAAELTPIIIGGPDEDNQPLADYSPEIINLTGKTRIKDLITLATYASFALGNDTGAMHIASASLCPVLGLFFGKHKPEVVGPRGIFYRHLYAPTKEKLELAMVLNSLPEFIDKFKQRTAS